LGGRRVTATLQVTPLELPDVKLVTPVVRPNTRGYFLERWNAAAFAAAGLDVAFVQDNQSRSFKGVVRGLHFQAGPHAQGKLVGVTRGRILDVAVDLRVGSPTFGRWVSAVLDDVKLQQLWLPAGFAHGFATLSEVADLIYKTDYPYTPAADAGVRWDDPTIGVAWQLEGATPWTSERDAVLPLLADLDRFPEARP